MKFSFLFATLLAFTPAEFNAIITKAAKNIPVTGESIVFFHPKQLINGLPYTMKSPEFIKNQNSLWKGFDSDKIALVNGATLETVLIDIKDLVDHDITKFHPGAFDLYKSLLQDRPDVSKHIAGAIGVAGLGAGGVGGWFLKEKMDDNE